MEAAFKQWYMDTFHLPWLSRSIGADRKNINEVYAQIKALSEAKGCATDNNTMLSLFKHSLEAGNKAKVWFMTDAAKFSLNNLNCHFNQVVAGITAKTQKVTGTTQAKFDFDE